MAVESEKQLSRVLVTGSAGAVGRAVCAELKTRGHFVRGFDRLPSPGVDESVQGDITDSKALDNAVHGMDCVIHLAATTDDADFTSELLPNNIIAVHSLMESARQHNVKRVILASSVQVISGVKKSDGPVVIEDGAAPKNMYAVTKVFAETIGQMYSLRYGISAIAIRLGWVPRRPQDLGKPQEKPWIGRIYLSHGDCGRLFAQCVEVADVPYAILFGMSLSDTPAIDVEPARKLVGYEPRDVYPQGLMFPVPKDLL